MKEKRDRKGACYLVAGLPMFGVVLFIRRDEEKGKDGRQRWRAVAKPYQKGEPVEDYPWPD